MSKARFLADLLSADGEVKASKVDAHSARKGSVGRTDLGIANQEQLTVDGSGNMSLPGTVDGVDIAARNSVLTSTTTTAGNALPKAGGAMTGTITNFTSTGIDDNATSTAVTITSGEDVLVTKTSSATASVGVELRANGSVFGTRDGGNSGSFNRLSSDGELVTFSKDSTQVGSIGTVGGSLYIASPYGSDSGMRFSGGTVHPCTTAGAPRDAAVDLGYSAGRYKDLYLSGTAHLDNISHKTSGWNYQDLPAGAGLKTRVGGTDALSLNGFNMTVSSGNLTLGGGNLVIGTSGKGIDFSANGNAGGMSSEVLDDYEEGTWTPVMRGSSTAGTWSANGTNGGFYVKIGKVVHIFGNCTGTLSGASGTAEILGLPFSRAGGNAAHGNNAMYTTVSISYWAGPPVDVGGFLVTPSTIMYSHVRTDVHSSGSTVASYNGSNNCHFAGSYVADA